MREKDVAGRNPMRKSVEQTHTSMASYKLDVQIVCMITWDLSMQGEPWCFYGVLPVEPECVDVNPKVDCGEL